jgi:hypothetical protein
MSAQAGGQAVSNAFKAWDTQSESLEQVEARIHDGAARGDLLPRARGYINVMFDQFGDIVNGLGEKPSVLEIGPGVGYLLQAFHERRPDAELHGLDVSPEMIGSARARLARDGLEGLAEFHHYDGADVPLADRRFDLVYSCATLQHIPKPYVYFLLTEIQRISRCCILHFIHWDHLDAQEQVFPFRNEVRAQIRGEVTHWHHFYDETELQSIFRHVLHTDCVLYREGGSVWLGAVFGSGVNRSRN